MGRLLLHLVPSVSHSTTHQGKSSEVRIRFLSAMMLWYMHSEWRLQMETILVRCMTFPKSKEWPGTNRPQGFHQAFSNWNRNRPRQENYSILGHLWCRFANAGHSSGWEAHEIVQVIGMHWEGMSYGNLSEHTKSMPRDCTNSLTMCWEQITMISFPQNYRLCYHGSSPCTGKPVYFGCFFRKHLLRCDIVIGDEHYDQRPYWIWAV